MSGSGSAGTNSTMAVGVGVVLRVEGEPPELPPDPVLIGVGSVVVVLEGAIVAGLEVAAAVDVGPGNSVAVAADVGVGDKVDPAVGAGELCVGACVVGAEVSVRFGDAVDAGFWVSSTGALPRQAAAKNSKLVMPTINRPMYPTRRNEFKKFPHSINLIFDLLAIRHCR